MHVWFAAAGFVQAVDCGGAEDADGDVLRDSCFAVAARCGGACLNIILDTRFGVAVEFFIEVGEVVGLGAGASEAAANAAETTAWVAGAGKGVGDDGKGEEGDVVSFC